MIILVGLHITSLSKNHCPLPQDGVPIAVTVYQAILTQITPQDSQLCLLDIILLLLHLADVALFGVVLILPGVEPTFPY